MLAKFDLKSVYHMVPVHPHDRLLLGMRWDMARPTCTGKVTALGVLCCFALFVCLTLLASFFLPSHLSFKNMYVDRALPFGLRSAPKLFTALADTLEWMMGSLVQST